MEKDDIKRTDAEFNPSSDFTYIIGERNSKRTASKSNTAKSRSLKFKNEKFNKKDSEGYRYRIGFNGCRIYDPDQELPKKTGFYPIEDLLKTDSDDNLEPDFAPSGEPRVNR